MFKSSPHAYPENASPELTFFLGPMVAIEMWLPVMCAVVDWNTDIIERVTHSQREWLDLANRRFAAYMAVPQYLGSCRSFENVCSVYADFFQKAVTDYQKPFAEVVKPDIRADSAADIHYANISATFDRSDRLGGDADEEVLADGR
jgi:hypothetical protein